MKPAIWLLTLFLLVSTIGPGTALQTESAARLPRFRVTLRERGQPLENVLAAMGDGKVRLTAVPHLLDRRATLFVRDRPLAEVMASMAELWSMPRYRAFWVRPKSGSADFELWQDPRAAREYERILSEDLARIGQSLARVMTLKDPQDPRAGVRTGNPALDRIIRDPPSASGSREIVAFLRELPGEARADVLRGKTVWLPFSQLSPGVQEVLTAPQGAGAREAEADRLERLRNSSFAVGPDIEPLRGTWMLLIRTRNREQTVWGATGFELGPVGMSQPAGASARERSRAREVASLPWPGDQALRDSLQQRARNRPPPGSPGSGWQEMADFHEWLAGVSGLPVISDYYQQKPAPHPDNLVGQAGWEDLLEAAVRERTYDWWVSRGALLFRNHRGPIDDAYEVPARLEARLSRALKSAGQLNLDELTEASRLSDSQLRQLFRLFPQALDLTWYRGVLAWRAALAKPAREHLDAGELVALAESGARGLEILYPRGARRDLLMDPFDDPRTVRFRLRQVTEGPAVVLRLEIHGEPGPPRIRELRQALPKK